MSFEVRQTPEFAEWHKGLTDHVVQDAITARLLRFQLSLMGDVKSVGGKVAEARVDVGPGYRLYYTKRGLALVIMLCGGDKARQQADISRAKALVEEMDRADKSSAKKNAAAKPRRGKRQEK